jgi:hypothetical protein
MVTVVTVMTVKAVVNKSGTNTSDNNHNRETDVLLTCGEAVECLWFMG